MDWKGGFCIAQVAGNRPAPLCHVQSGMASNPLCYSGLCPPSFRQTADGEPGEVCLPWDILQSMTLREAIFMRISKSKPNPSICRNMCTEQERSDSVLGQAGQAGAYAHTTVHPNHHAPYHMQSLLDPRPSSISCGGGMWGHAVSPPMLGAVTKFCTIPICQFLDILLIFAVMLTMQVHPHQDPSVELKN